MTFAYIPPPNDGLDISYVDPALLVVNKPSGLLSVPGRGDDKQDCLARRVQAAFPEARIVHRLDLHTSGLLIMARGSPMQRQLSRLFAARRIEKRYLAVVEGALPAGNGIIELPLLADWPRRPRQKVDFVAGKPARTRYRLLQYDPVDDASRVALWPETGRTHQLRVHLQAIGHPIVGDTLYGSRAAALPKTRLLLHADYLSLPHPLGGHCLCIASPPPF